MRSLTPEHRQCFIEVATSDVSYWEWAYWSRLAAKEGRCSMGLIHVLLPYRYEPSMPVLRRELNGIYLEALRLRAADFGMEIAMEESENRIYLVAPATSQ